MRKATVIFDETPQYPELLIYDKILIELSFSLFVNTSSEFDGSDSGARPDEAISWGKIR